MQANNMELTEAWAPVWLMVAGDKVFLMGDKAFFNHKLEGDLMPQKRFRVLMSFSHDTDQVVQETTGAVIAGLSSLWLDELHQIRQSVLLYPGLRRKRTAARRSLCAANKRSPKTTR